MIKSDKICIVGAGLVGSMIASYLTQRGIACDIYEKRPDIRKNYQSGNRTITMSISYRGIQGLAGIGLADYIDKFTIPKHSRMVHDTDGSTSTQMYGKFGHSINTINRKHLNETLMNKAEESGLASFFFEHQCESLNPDTGEITFLKEHLHETVTAQYNHIIGADGLFSNVRQILESHNLVNSEYIHVNHGYRELLIPSDANGNYILAHDHVHVWPRGSHIMVGLPSQHGQFTCNLFLPATGEDSLASMQTEEAVRDLFKRKFPLLIPLMPTLLHDYIANPASNINAIKCSPWNYKNKILLLGDAAHAIVPFFAMGMNTCFEDCTIFDKLMDEYNNNVSEVFEKYYKRRKPDTDVIGDISYKNFSEILKSPEENYQLKWQLERTLWDLFPDRWMPLYPMVAFTNIPFRVALQQAMRQEKILSDALASNNFNEFNIADTNPQHIYDYFKPLLDNFDKITQFKNY